MTVRIIPPIYSPLLVFGINLLITFSNILIKFPINLTGCGIQYGSPKIKSNMYPITNATKEIVILNLLLTKLFFSYKNNTQ